MQQGSSIKPVVARAEGWFAVFGRIGVMPGMYGGGAAEDETQEKALQGSDSLQKMYSASYLCPYIWRCGTEIRMCGRTEPHRKTPSFHIYRILIIVFYTGAAGSFLRHDVRIPCVNRINRPEVLSLLFSSLSFAVVHLLS